MGSGISVDHDHCVAKNTALAKALELDTRDASLKKKGYDVQQRQQEASCFSCKMKQKCPQFRTKRSGGATGVVSVGGGETFVCSRFVPTPAKSFALSDKQVKSLLKNAMRGIR
jgi:hypothetical protein